jgi:hypothetical protein
MKRGLVAAALAVALGAQAGPYLPEQKLSAHELDFWGGDLASLSGRPDPVQALGADALDFQAISPVYGTRADFKRLAADAHLMDDTPRVDVLGLVSSPAPMSFGPGFITVELPPQPKALGRHNRCKRVP